MQTITTDQSLSVFASDLSMALLVKNRQPPTSSRRAEMIRSLQSHVFCSLEFYGNRSFEVGMGYFFVMLQHSVLFFLQISSLMNFPELMDPRFEAVAQ
jgi:hypothetical protein